MNSLADIIAAINDEVVIEAYMFPTASSEHVIAADSAAVAAGHRAIGSKWHPLSGSPSVFLAHHIGHDLAYSATQLIDRSKCASLANQLIEHADDDAVWYANHNSSFDDIIRGSYGWTPISTWTFDVAYVAVGTKNTLFVCFFAED